MKLIIKIRINLLNYYCNVANSLHAVEVHSTNGKHFMIQINQHFTF